MVQELPKVPFGRTTLWWTQHSCYSVSNRDKFCFTFFWYENAERNRQIFSIFHSSHGIRNELYQVKVSLHFVLKATLEMWMVTGNRRRRQPIFELPVSLSGWGI